MAEESKQAFDPDATVAQPLAAITDPDATLTQPLAAVTDPDATVSQPIPVVDPEATFTGPAGKALDAEATGRQPAFDPEATVNPAERPILDPEATGRLASLGRRRHNPFAPKSLPDSLQANLSALGGINPLVAMANPILAAVPQIRRTLRHPDPALLQENLRAQIESLETSAISAEISDDTVAAAVYALCALLDESAAATPWGRDWIEHGLLQALRGESGAAEGFFTQLDQLAAEPEKNADLLEFMYICLALGFEGRYRGAADGRQALDQVRDLLYGVIARRRPRPEALSAHWRTPAAQAAADAALQTAARANAARAAAEAAARAAAEKAATSEPPSRFALAHWPRRAIWSAVAGIVGAALVFYMLALRLQDDETRNAMAARPSAARASAAAAPRAAAPGPSAPAAATAPAGTTAQTAATALASALQGLPVVIGEDAGRIAISLRDARQFASGRANPSPQADALLMKIADALDKLPGAIVVVGHADGSPPGVHYASNQALSEARARAVADAMAARLADPKRVSAEGRADAEPLAPNDSEANRARNRRVVVELRARP